MMIRAGIAMAAVLTVATITDSSDPFGFISPSVPAPTVSERARLDAGEPLVRMLPARDTEVALFAAVRVRADGGRLSNWSRDIARLDDIRYIRDAGRFSQPPVVDDVQGITLDEQDLKDIATCEPGDCGLKLDDAEIAQLRGVIARSGPHWKTSLQRAFRGILVSRARRYLAAGLDGATYHDASRVVALDDEAIGISKGFGFLAPWPRRSDAWVLAGVNPATLDERFLYWSVERLGGRPIISITESVTARYTQADLPDAVVVSTRVFATHYIDGSTSVTAIAGGHRGTPRYLVYVNRSRVDLLDGFWGKFVRHTIQRRVRAEAPDVLTTLRARLEGEESGEGGGPHSR